MSFLPWILQQLERARQAAARLSGGEETEQARRRIERWEALLGALAEGAVRPGKRTPVRGLPPWVSLEVLHGGFASGRALAERELESWELDQLSDSDRRGPDPRGRLHARLLDEEALRRLARAAREGRLRLELPEEGFLPAIALLVEEGRTQEALGLLETILPFLSQLRFAPRVLDEAAVRDPAELCLQPVGELTQGLVKWRTPVAIRRQRQALEVRAPLYDELVRLWQETVEGEPPRWERQEGRSVLRGGAPGARVPEGWLHRREMILARIAAAEEGLEPSLVISRRRGFSVLRQALAAWNGRGELDPKIRLGVRRVLAGWAGRLPGSEGHRAWREGQRAQLGPLHADFVPVLLGRLRPFVEDEGLLDPEAVLGPVRPEEAAFAGAPLPAPLTRRVRRSRRGPLAALVEQGLVPSLEVFSRLVPVLSAQAAFSEIPEPGRRHLLAEGYRAFRRRRSLLLLDFQHQVRFEELPWVAALDAGTERGGVASRRLLEVIVLLALRAFPATALPNSLLRELAALSGRAGLDLPLVEELAADIFMGDFTAKWGRCAARTAEALQGSVYARYFDLPPPTAPPPRGLRRSAAVDRSFGALCRRRLAPLEPRLGGPVARNGALIEQALILCAQNLAVLVEDLGLRPRLGPLAPELARRCLAALTRQARRPPADPLGALRERGWRARALRQDLFFLSLIEEPRATALVAAWEQEVEATPGAESLVPVARGLRFVLEGGRFDPQGRGPEGAARLLGWVNK